VIVAFHRTLKISEGVIQKMEAPPLFVCYPADCSMGVGKRIYIDCSVTPFSVKEEAFRKTINGAP